MRAATARLLDALDDTDALHPLIAMVLKQRAGALSPEIAHAEFVKVSETSGC
jgi:hypothetical protein